MKQAGCNEVDKSMNKMEEFNYTVEQFADLQLLRYKVYGFEELSLKQKELIYYCHKLLCKVVIFCLIRMANTICLFVKCWKPYIQSIREIVQM